MERTKSSGLVLVFTVVFAIGVAETLGQTFGEIKDYRVAERYEPPHETQIKSLLEGAKARRIAEGLWLLTDARVTTFRFTGEPDLLVKTPQCFFNQTSNTASSPGPLHAQMADGSFSIEGVGFQWRQTNSSLIISNQVHTVVRPKMLGPDSNQRGQDMAAMPQTLEIFSHSFDYTNNPGVAVYREAVRVAGTNLSLTSQELMVDLPMNDRQVRSITAEHNVVIDYTNANWLHATGDHAVYETGTGLIRVTGNPVWQVDQREGRGDELVVDRTNRIFQANGHAWLKLPDQNAGTFSFLSASNAQPTGSTGPTNRSIEVTSSTYELRTNSAVFRQNVRVSDLLGDQVRGKMSSGIMQAFFSGSNELQSLVAETNVVISEDEKQMTGGKAVYSATNGWLELTDHPAWKAGTREGNGDLLRVMTQHDEMQVLGNAHLRLAASELGTTEAFGQTSSSPKKDKAGPREAQYANINCREYTLRPELGIFEGGVHATHPQMDWVCDRLTVRSLSDNCKILLADGGVVFDLTDDRGQKVHGKGDTVYYTNSVTGTITNEMFYLRGNPAVLINTNATVHNSVITLDRRNNLITTPGGDYSITGTAAADTNMFKLPKGAVKK